MQYSSGRTIIRITLQRVNCRPHEAIGGDPMLVFPLLLWLHWSPAHKRAIWSLSCLVCDSEISGSAGLVDLRPGWNTRASFEACRGGDVRGPPAYNTHYYSYKFETLDTF